MNTIQHQSNQKLIHLGELDLQLYAFTKLDFVRNAFFRSVAASNINIDCYKIVVFFSFFIFNYHKVHPEPSRIDHVRVRVCVCVCVRKHRSKYDLVSRFFVWSFIRRFFIVTVILGLFQQRKVIGFHKANSHENCNLEFYLAFISII